MNLIQGCTHFVLSTALQRNLNCTGLKRKTVCYTRDIFVPSDKSLHWKRNLTSARPRAHIHVQRVGYRMDHPRFESQKVQMILSTPKRPNRLWGPFSLLFNGYGIFFWRWLIGRVVRLTTPKSHRD
jgi:hypothetical protein